MYRHSFSVHHERRLLFFQLLSANLIFSASKWRMFTRSNPNLDRQLLYDENDDSMEFRGLNV